MSEPETVDDTAPEAAKAPAAAPAPSRRRARVIVMLVVSVIAVAGLALLKTNAAEEHKAEATSRAQAEAIRVATEAEIEQHLLSTYGGISADATQVALVTRVGGAISRGVSTPEKPVNFRFRLLAEPNALNVFALARGDVYITTALLNRMKTEGQLAAALAHGAAHAQLGDVLTARVAAEGAPALPAWRYDARQELAADSRALAIMAAAGYDPNAYIGLFAILSEAHGAGADTQFFLSHPNSTGRLEAVAAAIRSRYPDGVPAELSK
jgi:predicted Zn-dependent protease